MSADNTGNKEAVKTEEGERKVIELLKLYENGEEWYPEKMINRQNIVGTAIIIKKEVSHV